MRDTADVAIPRAIGYSCERASAFRCARTWLANTNLIDGFLTFAIDKPSFYVDDESTDDK